MGAMQERQFLMRTAVSHMFCDCDPEYCRHPSQERQLKEAQAASRDKAEAVAAEMDAMRENALAAALAEARHSLAALQRQHEAGQNSLAELQVPHSTLPLLSCWPGILSSDMKQSVGTGCFLTVHTRSRNVQGGPPIPLIRAWQAVAAAWQMDFPVKMRSKKMGCEGNGQ